MTPLTLNRSPKGHVQLKVSDLTMTSKQAKTEVEVFSIGHDDGEVEDQALPVVPQWPLDDGWLDACTTKEFYTEKWHCATDDCEFIKNMTTEASQTDVTIACTTKEFYTDSDRSWAPSCGAVLDLLGQAGRGVEGVRPPIDDGGTVRDWPLPLQSPPMAFLRGDAHAR